MRVAAVAVAVVQPPAAIERGRQNTAVVVRLNEGVASAIVARWAARASVSRKLPIPARTFWDALLPRRSGAFFFFFFVGASSILMCRLPAMDMRTLFHPTCSASNKEARKAE